MNDFERVRLEIPFPPKTKHHEDFAALDRIEAEVERLREERNGFFNLTRELETEVERLRANQERLREAIDAEHAEVERLRAALEKIANGGYDGRGDNSLSPGGVTRFTYTKKGLRAIARAALAKEEA